MPTPDSAPRIVDYEPRHRDAFRDLNLAWITRHFVVEPADLEVFDDPEGAILEPGGCILLAEEEGEIVGTCALIKLHDGAFELAKMAVAPSAQGRGIGLLLGRTAVARARELGARRLELCSNRVLEPALRLYRKLGFVEAPLGTSEYRRADIRMVLELG
ncbi:MAG TPA: GNAT family N-acetyltransferase [Gemmatimonadales bacterium]|jgi:GNAT superfamily N-acetyltransferase|nr:GNAT family N-acetyltransferase [Gemmatimonadales bacterium]